MASTSSAPKEDPNSASAVKMSRTDWKKQKELEEARKAGTAPPEVDEEGRDINPHIPQYITQVPWYLGHDRPTLKHQRVPEEKKKEFSSLDQWYKRGVSQAPVATKFRKGACENCGAMTHKKKDCLERPRRVGAKFTGEDIQPDEHVQPELDFDFAGKRDRWAGYDVENHKKVVEEYAKVEQAKQHLKAAQLEDDLDAEKVEAVVKGDYDEDDDKYAEEVVVPGQKFDSKCRTTVRNLRIREDTAKYLYNLDPNSAYYDPKTRSMRQNPLSNTDKGRDVMFYGDNWVRSTGDVKGMANTQLFAWDAYERGADVHLQADPTKLELLHKEFKVKKDSHENEKKNSIIDKYGGSEHLEAPAKELLIAQTEEYVEYSRSGKIVRGQEKAIAKSKYEEDVLINNHTSVWGSYWNDFSWGYDCCHSLVKQSYCTGEAGKMAGRSVIPGTSIEDDNHAPKSLVELHKEKLNSASTSKLKTKSKDEPVDEKKQLQDALKEEEEREREAEKILKMDERKRPYNSLNVDWKEPSKEQMEAYQMKRQRTDDPMAQFMKKKSSK